MSDVKFGRSAKIQLSSYEDVVIKSIRSSLFRDDQVIVQIKHASGEVLEHDVFKRAFTIVPIVGANGINAKIATYDTVREKDGEVVTFRNIGSIIPDIDSMSEKAIYASAQTVGVRVSENSRLS